MTIDVNSYHECASTIVDAASHNQNDIIINRAISTIDAVDNNTDDAIIKIMTIGAVNNIPDYVIIVIDTL